MMNLCDDIPNSTDVAFTVRSYEAGIDALEEWRWRQKSKLGFIPAYDFEELITWFDFLSMERLECESFPDKQVSSAVSTPTQFNNNIRWFAVDEPIYCKSGDDIVAELYGGVKQNWMSAGWNNGTGCRFYEQLLMQRKVIPRLLMHGVNAGGQADIPSGSVFGQAKDGSVGQMNVGRDGMMTVLPHSN